MTFVAAALLAIIVGAAPAPTPTPEPSRPASSRRGYRPWLDGTATLLAASFVVVTGAGRRAVAPRDCRWCDAGPADLSVRDALRWDRTGNAVALSHVTGYLYAPGVALGLHAIGLSRGGELSSSGEDFLVVLEAVSISTALTNATKLASARQRPYAHFDAQAPDFGDDPEQNLGFFSGHTSLAFSFVVSTATVSTLRGTKTAPWIWGIGMPLAGLTGYFRVAADRHYLSDVLVGAAVGSAVGVVVPVLVHRAGPRWRRKAGHGRPQLRLVPSGQGVLLTGAF